MANQARDELGAESLTSSSNAEGLFGEQNFNFHLHCRPTPRTRALYKFSSESPIVSINPLMR